MNTEFKWTDEFVQEFILKECNKENTWDKGGIKSWLQKFKDSKCTQVDQLYPDWVEQGMKECQRISDMIEKIKEDRAKEKDAAFVMRLSITDLIKLRTLLNSIP